MMYLLSLWLIHSITETVIITVLMSLSADSNISVISVSVLMDFSSHDRECFPCLCMSGNLLVGCSDVAFWMLNVSIPINILDLCFGMQLNYLEVI